MLYVHSGAGMGEPDEGTLEVLNMETRRVRSIPLSHVQLLGCDPKEKEGMRLRKRISRPDHPIARVCMHHSVECDRIYSRWKGHSFAVRQARC